ncbi:MAG: hypothetical protein LBD32_01125, partial [Cytophagales bacterium]|nr:hypothetical protein [Cytophagales bacterium]
NKKKIFNTFDWEKFPLIFDDNGEYKILGKKVLNKQIFLNLVKILKLYVKPLKVAESDKIKKDRYVFDPQLGFPVTSAVEASIVGMCQRFKIGYQKDFSRVVYTGEDFDSCKNFCLVFITYILNKFAKEFKFENKEPFLECANSCGLLSAHEPFCFLGHQVVGLVWAIMNTALSSFSIEKIDDIEELHVDVRGLFKVEMSTLKIRQAVRNSLLGGAGFYVKGLIEECTTFVILQNVFNDMNGYATLDYRYGLNLAKLDYFEYTGFGALADIGNTAFSKIKIPPKKQQNQIFTEKGLDGNTYFGKCPNFFLASIAVVKGIVGRDGGQQDRAEGFYFANFDSVISFLECLGFISVKTPTNEILSDFSQIVYSRTRKSLMWEPVLDGEIDSTQYSKFDNAFLCPLYKEYQMRYKGSTGYPLGDCAQIVGGMNFQAPGGGPPTDSQAQNYFFTIIYRTYEAILAYIFFTIIFRSDNWIVHGNPA